MKKVTSEEIRAARQNKERLLSEYTSKHEGFRERHVKTLPKVYRWLFFLVYTQKNSKARAIKAKCLDCSNYQKEEIRNCNCRLCPLFDIRPYQK